MLTGKFRVNADDGIVFFDDGMQFGSGRITPFGIKEGFGEALRDIVSDGTVTFMDGTVCGRRGMVSGGGESNESKTRYAFCLKE